MDTMLYEINENIGFFSNMKYRNKNISVLIINNYMTNEEIQLLNNISINNEKLVIDNIFYKSIENNISIIQIKKIIILIS